MAAVSTGSGWAAQRASNAARRSLRSRRCASRSFTSAGRRLAHNPRQDGLPDIVELGVDLLHTLFEVTPGLALGGSELVQLRVDGGDQVADGSLIQDLRPDGVEQPLLDRVDLDRECVGTDVRAFLPVETAAVPPLAASRLTADDDQSPTAGAATEHAR